MLTLDTTLSASSNAESEEQPSVRGSNAVMRLEFCDQYQSEHHQSTARDSGPTRRMCVKPEPAIVIDQYGRNELPGYNQCCQRSSSHLTCQENGRQPVGRPE